MLKIRLGAMDRIPTVLARKLSQWTVEGTDLTVTADTSLHPHVRDRIREDLAQSVEGVRYLPCFHLGARSSLPSGSYLHGRGWKMVTPSNLDAELFRLAARDALVSPWVQTVLSGSPCLLTQP